MKSFQSTSNYSSIFPQTMVAAIDLGTNSCRLLVARVDPTGMKIIDSFSRVVRLGEGIQKTGQLSDAAIERAIEALKVCQTKIIQNNASRLRAVTTEACRRASNSHILLDRVKDEINIDLEIITTAEEARLALSGCAGILENHSPYAVAFDIGGGSTEVMWLDQSDMRDLSDEGDSKTPLVEDWISLPYGVVTLSEESGTELTTAAVFDAISDNVKEQLQAFSDRNGIGHFIETDQVQMIGTSGTVTTLAAIHLDLARYDRRLIDGIYLNLEDIKRISKQLKHMDHKARVSHPCIGTGRADLVVVGAAILDGICRSFSVPRIRVADRGVREGILIDLMREWQQNYALASQDK